MIGVVDTSALIRLFIPDGPMPEGFEDFLRGVERGLNTAIAPELLMAESANVISKKQKAKELSGAESEQLLATIMSLPIRLFPHRSLLLRAFDLSITQELSVYDTLYLALAEEHGAVVFTADRIDAKKALHIGLINQVVPREQLVSKADEIARRIMSNDAHALEYAKAAIIRGLDMPLHLGLQMERRLATALTNI